MKIQLLDHGSIELVEHWGSDESIIRAARMSTDKGFLGWGVECFCCVKGRDGTEECRSCNGTGIHKPGDEKLLRYLYENRHDTPFEMAGVILEVQAPIFVFREWHRHRTWSFNEMSARYIPLPDLGYMPTVERLLTNAKDGNRQAGTVAGADELTEPRAEMFRKALKETYEQAQEMYELALSMGVPKELARVHLPVGRYSRMRGQVNLRNALAFLSLRNSPKAQYEIRVYAEAMQTILKDLFPRTMELYEGGTRK